MKKDIAFLPVTGVKVAVARQISEAGTTEWRVYLLNDNDAPLTNVLVTANGYGSPPDQPVGERLRTSTLRHGFPLVEARDYVAVELIDPSVFHLTSEYWVSYYLADQVYDKKFIFVPESITEANLIPIPQLGLDGVLHD